MAKRMDFISEYKRLKARGFPIQEMLDFIKDLSSSDDIEAHFRICCMEAESPLYERKIGAPFSFCDRGRAGTEYLLPLLEGEERTASHAAYLLAFCDKRRLSISQVEEEAIRRALSRLAESGDAMIRRRSIIAIGWIGTEQEIPLLNRHLLTDEDAYCRAWSASSFLQMSDRLRETLQVEAKDSMIGCLKSEQDTFVKGTAVEAVMAVWDVSFGLRSSTVEERNRKAIDRAAKKALLFLEQEERCIRRGRSSGSPGARGLPRLQFPDFQAGAACALTDHDLPRAPIVSPEHSVLPQEGVRQLQDSPARQSGSCIGLPR